MYSGKSPLSLLARADNFALMVYGVGGFTHGSIAGPFSAVENTLVLIVFLGWDILTATSSPYLCYVIYNMYIESPKRPFIHPSPRWSVPTSYPRPGPQRDNRQYRLWQHRCHVVLQVSSWRREAPLQ